MSKSDITKNDLISAYNLLVGEDDAVKGFRSVSAGREKIQSVLDALSAEELAALPEMITQPLEDCGFKLDELAAASEEIPEPETGKEEETKERRFRGQELADPRLSEWFTENQPKRGEFGNHCHERVYIMMDLIAAPATKAELAAATGSTEAVVANAIHDFRNADRTGKRYHTPDNKRKNVYMKRINGQAFYSLTEFEDDTSSENAEAASAAMESIAA